MKLTTADLAYVFRALWEMDSPGARSEVELGKLTNRVGLELADRVAMGESLPGSLEFAQEMIGQIGAAAAGLPRDDDSKPIALGFELSLAAGERGTISIQAAVPIRPWRFSLETNPTDWIVERILQDPLLFSLCPFPASRLSDDEWRDTLRVIQTAQVLHITLQNASAEPRTFKGCLWCRMVQ